MESGFVEDDYEDDFEDYDDDFEEEDDESDESSNNGDSNDDDSDRENVGKKKSIIKETMERNELVSISSLKFF